MKREKTEDRAAPGSPPTPCQTCHGSKEVRRATYRGGTGLIQSETGPVMAVSYDIDTIPCPACSNTTGGEPHERGGQR